MDITKILVARPDILDSEDKLKRVLADVFSPDSARVNRLMRAYNVGIFESVMRGQSDSLTKQKLVDRLVDVHDMKPLKAWEAVEEWYGMVTPAVLESYRKYRVYPVSKAYLSGDTEAILCQIDSMAESLKANDSRVNINQEMAFNCLDDIRTQMAGLQRQVKWGHVFMILEGVAFVGFCLGILGL